jgi:hypothetical protein
MKIRIFMLLAALVGPVAVGTTAQGGVLGAIARDTCEVNRWPYPYVCWDREAVYAPFPGMIENAWRRQNLLADCHFVVDGTQLSQAGQSKVRWILTEAPLQHRTVFVRRGETAEQTTARVNSIREYAAKVAPEGGPPNIVETNVSLPGYPAGWPGGKDPTLSRRFQGFVPEKLYIPSRSNTSGSSSGGGTQ